mgnify:CR=1 FL=1
MKLTSLNFDHPILKELNIPSPHFPGGGLHADLRFGSKTETSRLPTRECGTGRNG